MNTPEYWVIIMEYRMIIRTGQRRERLPKLRAQLVNLILKNNMEKFARRCDITGRGMNEGYVFGDGEMYASDDESALIVAKQYGYESLDEAFDDDAYYYTEWEVLDDEFFYDKEGNEYESNIEEL